MDEIDKKEAKAAKKEKKEKREKKAKPTDDEEVTKKDKKRKVEEAEEDADDVQPVTRRRTRTMSDAEEHFKLVATTTTEDFRKEHQITVVGKDESGTKPFECPDPMLTFESSPFAQPIRNAFVSAGFSNPTPTQGEIYTNQKSFHQHKKKIIFTTLTHKLISNTPSLHALYLHSLTHQPNRGRLR